MDDLESTYQTQYALYEEAIASPNPDAAKIKQLNIQIAKTLNAMIETLTNVNKETASIKVYRDELIQRLRQIQWEYNGLIQNTDNLETLRRIRESEQKKADGSFYIYFYGFVAACIALVIAILMKQESLPISFFPGPTPLLPQPSAPLL